MGSECDDESSHCDSYGVDVYKVLFLFLLCILEVDVQRLEHVCAPS